MFIPRPLPSRRITAAVAALALTAGCAVAADTVPVAAPRGAAAGLMTTPTPTSTADPRPAVTVPPLVATDASPSDATAAPTADAPDPGTDAPAAADTAVATLPTESPAVEPPAAEPTAPAPPTEAAPPATLALPALTAPYDHVLGFHGAARTVYLTFDDGPGPQTPAVLDVLDAAGVKATFCQVGDRIAEYPAVEQRVIAGGHTLCNHSWDHQLHLGSADAAVIDGEISRAQDAFAAAGATVHWFRAPGGDFGTTDVLRRVAQSRGVVPLGWGVDSRDWTKPGVDAIVTTVLSQVSPGAVVLLHDAGGADRDQTVAVLPRIIDGLRAAGYDLQPLPPGGL